MSEEIKNKVYMALTGALTGLANGFFGGGGGMIVVPLMSFLLKMKTKTAHATALAVILPITVVSAIVYFTSGNFDFATGIPSGVGVVLGGIIGAWLLGKLSANWLTKIFAVVMLVAGVKSLFF
ncbi:MAG: sulfite exporter TauE/SafE family protein [Clostridiales bacterium]|nr:sulfite exporter TauE/SafE family protein [Clostridiales bacterium]